MENYQSTLGSDHHTNDVFLKREQLEAARVSQLAAESEARVVAAEQAAAARASQLAAESELRVAAAEQAAEQGKR